jgi:hypothetical protein
MPYSSKGMHALRAVHEENTVKPQFYFFLWRLPNNGIKSRKCYGHLARTVQEVCKIMEDAKCRNIEWAFTVFM